MTPPTRDGLIRYLVRSGIAGSVATPRDDNLRHYRRLAEGNPYYALGLRFDRSWSYPEILQLMTKRCGVVPDEDYTRGVDTIDPERTVDALEAAADRMGEAAQRGERVMFATGHPGSLLGTYQVWARALAERGARQVVAGAGYEYQQDRDRQGPRRRVVTWDEGVAFVSDGHEPRHSHHAEGMNGILGALDRQDWPDMVVADHGFAGAAGQAGLDVIGFADCNDPGLFVGEAEGRINVAVPLDDGYTTSDYEPLASYVLHRAGL
ncbi:phosphatase [Lipingzhangella sp. LS1_29]|uniref:Phosphatase n=1 Tax=Lipingzhangella rawalii TaxID=2055835 RepID=A0ABU2HAW6_9ACTN|nr:phosphatase [Lipingzhangella rawalii]MDS1271729.1 phosphatase [Lipingzhangella rawalii]